MERNLLSLIYLTLAWTRMAMHSAIAQGRELSFYITISCKLLFSSRCFLRALGPPGTLRSTPDGTGSEPLKRHEARTECTAGN